MITSKRIIFFFKLKLVPLGLKQKDSLNGNTNTNTITEVLFFNLIHQFFSSTIIRTTYVLFLNLFIF